MQSLRRANAVGLHATPIEWQGVPFTTEAFDVLRQSILRELSKTVGLRHVLSSSVLPRCWPSPARGYRGHHAKQSDWKLERHRDERANILPGV